tara:strand:- start:1038 stop:1892 length:855 start_codon:yes stop_codon:yes gene_type:complete
MSRVAYVNGNYLDFKKSLVHIEDRGYQFADGVYEVFNVSESKLVDYDLHLKRLYRSLGELKIKSPISKYTYIYHIKNIIRMNIMTDGLIYLQITRGVAPRDHKFPTEQKSSIVITGRHHSADEYEIKFKKGINVTTHDDIRWGRCDIKTVSLLPNVLAKQDAYIKGASEAWLINKEGYITEGCASNAWILRKDNTLITHPSNNSILTGITRTSFIKGLKKHSIKFKELRFKMNDVKVAKEAFATSATQHVTPVVKVDKIKIGNGKPGKFASIFRNAYMEALQLK